MADIIPFFVIIIFGTAGVATFVLMRKKSVPVIVSLTAGILLVAALLAATILAFRVRATLPWKLAFWVACATATISLAACIIWLICRFFVWLGASDPAGGTVNPEERQRIIGMVEQNKMTAQDGTELLDALGKSSALRGQQTFSRLDVMILIGIAATVMGFFLPWRWLRNVFDSMGLVMYQNGYQVKVVGWGMLVASALATALVFITPKGYLYKLLLLQMLCICVGLALVLSVWLEAGTSVGYGAIICASGFAVALLGSLMKMRALAR
jgi:hypothetical protein